MTSKLKGAAGIINAGSIKLVMAGSGCENSEKVEEVINCIQFLLSGNFIVLHYSVNVLNVRFLYLISAASLRSFLFFSFFFGFKC